MSFLPTLFSPSLYLEMPQGWIGWAGWFAQLILISFLVWKWHKAAQKPKRQRAGLIFLLLFVFTVLSSLFVGVRLPAGAAMPPPGMPVDPAGAAVMVFAAVPWALAAGLLGILPAAFLGLVSGVVQALWGTHNPFTPLEWALLASLFAEAVNQRYRTRIFRVLRHPLAAVLLLAIVYPLISILNSIFMAGGILVSRLDYAFTNLTGSALATGVELLVAGVFAEGVAITLPHLWGRQTDLQASPAERSLQARFLSNMAPLAGLLVLILMVSDWIVAGRAAQEMIQARMGSAAEMASQNVPFFLEAGQNLVTQMASDPRLDPTQPAGDLNRLLAENIRRVPFFSQLYLFDETGTQVTGYPNANYLAGQPPREEQMGISLALTGLPVQTYSVPPAEDKPSAQVAFVASIHNESNEVVGVLIGRSDLVSNPYTQPVLASLENLAGLGGHGLLLDEHERIVFQPDPKQEQIMTPYTGKTGSEPVFYDEIGPDGTRRLVFYQPAAGSPWAVVLRVPAHRTQELALEIAAPLLAVILILALLSIVILRLGLKAVTSSLQNLSLEAGRIAQGKLEHPLLVDGEDEVGHLRRSFEQMRASLKDRLDELNRLLFVSQGVASSLEMGEAVKPVLEAALGSGACSARVVLSPAVVPELDGIPGAPAIFGLGPCRNQYSYLDEQILAFTRQQDRLVMATPNRPRLLHFPPNQPQPGSLLAVALRHENLYYGTLWVAYQQAHNFSEEEVRFLATLAGQAALAAANARLFLNAEIGRQRLAAILASTPDPVLVTDQHDRLLLANPASWQALGLGMEAGEGQPIERVILQKELVDLLRSRSQDTASLEKQSIEVELPDGQIYLATASSVLAEGQRVGRVCVLRDVTHFKELDALKSEFVSTVSHDLRSPLTLMRGYATMLEMVGQLNEQQAGYVRKIVGGVESMSRLVNNLLDLGRIEAGIGLQLEMLPVQDVVERVVGALQLQASQKRIQLGYEIAPNAAQLIEADQALLQQALQNLVENAIKYTRNEGKVLVRVESRDDRVTFEVQDSGIGISPMDQPRLFEKFFRGAQQAAREQRGTGLGLAIVKSIAERHGGQVWVESQLGKGSSFYLTLPVRQHEMELEM